MSEVVALRGEVVTSDARQAFLDAVATSFDRYVEQHGREPDALVYAFGGIGQPSNTGWLVRGESEKGAGCVIARAALHLMREM